MDKRLLLEFHSYLCQIKSFYLVLMCLFCMVLMKQREEVERCNCIIYFSKGVLLTVTNYYFCIVFVKKKTLFFLTNY